MFTPEKILDPMVVQLLDDAEAAKSQGDFTAALRYCEKAYARDLECVEALEEIADNYISLEEFGKAKKAVVHALTIDAESANANFLMGFILIKAGRFEEAITFLTKADSFVGNHPEILRNLGWAYYNNKEATRGLLILERALNVAPDDTYIMCDLGICYINEKNFDKALELFERALTLEPENKKFVECIKTAEYFKREFEKYIQT